MKLDKKDFALIATVAVLLAGSIGGYYAYQDYLKKTEPNIEEVASEPISVATVSEELAVGKDPAYTGLSTEATGLYPTLSGVEEPIWNDFESYPIDICSEGTDAVTASFKLIWSKRYLYFQVKVYDTTYDTGGDTYSNQDSVEIFLNEDGNKNRVLTVGDSHYIVNRDNVRTAGFGADSSFESIVYGMNDEAGNSTGYVVEAVIPLLTIKAAKNNSIGLEVQVNNAVPAASPGGETYVNEAGETVPVVIHNMTVMNWASSYRYTFQNYEALGTMTFK